MDISSHRQKIVNIHIYIEEKVFIDYCVIGRETNPFLDHLNRQILYSPEIIGFN